jgi:hypothetical protein
MWRLLRYLFEDNAGRGSHLEGINLHQVAGLGDRVALVYAKGPGRKSRRDPGRLLRGAFTKQPGLFKRVRIRPTRDVDNAGCSAAQQNDPNGHYAFRPFIV